MRLNRKPLALICLALAAIAATACNVTTGVVMGVGRDITSVKATSQDDCCSKCNAQGCACWTFHSAGIQKDTCWLHSACSPTKQETGAVSGTRDGPMPPTPPPSPQPGWYPCTTNVSASFKFCDTTLDLDTRVSDLVSRVTTAEAGAQLTARQSPSIAALGLPAYYWVGVLLCAIFHYL